MIVNIILICGKCRGKQKYKGYNNHYFLSPKLAKKVHFTEK